MPNISQRAILLRTFRNNKTSAVGVLMTLMVVAVALIAPWISPYDPISQDMNVQHAPPSWVHPFGTDSYGRDQLSSIQIGRAHV
jgi:peptide/nickel transport system permease protein